MKKLNPNLIARCVAECTNSDYFQRIGAIIFKGKRIISQGHNSINRHVNRIKPQYRKWQGTIHAELAAVLDAKQSVAGFDLLVTRLTAKGDLALAMPCECCEAYCRYVGIRNVYYSDNNGEIIRMKL